jgi:uncharacterized membrane protein/predicted RNA-binding Zn-ribbon protein involved in translation (DUF1610 family)
LGQDADNTNDCRHRSRGQGRKEAPAPPFSTWSAATTKFQEDFTMKNIKGDKLDSVPANTGGVAFCGSCGAQVQDGVKFCPSCGKEVAAGAQQAQPQAQPQYQQPQQAYQPQTQQAPASDAQTNKVMAILSYIIFFIPLITGDHKKSPFVKFHVNQGTLLAIVAIAYSIISGILSAVIKVPYSVWGVSTGYYHTPGWLSTILWIISLGVFALCIYGIYNAATGKTKELPVIGKFKIIK